MPTLSQNMAKCGPKLPNVANNFAKTATHKKQSKLPKNQTKLPKIRYYY